MEWAISGRSMLALYQVYYKFPFLLFQIEPSAFLTGVVASVLAASAGGAFVLIKIFKLTPAVAMQPPVPVDFSHAAKFNDTFKRILDQPTRMVIRRLLRQPQIL